MSAEKPVTPHGQERAMPECDYCGESSDTERAHLEHLSEEHEGELGPIDRRRVDELEGDSALSGVPTGPIVLMFVVFAAAAVVAYVTLGGGGGASGGTSGVAVDGIEAEPLPDRGNEEYLQDVQSYPEMNPSHVSRGSQIDYSTMPPVGGDHHGSTVGAGFYAEQQPLGSVVHSLEHGAVVVYYDPAAIDSEAQDSLKEYASKHTGTWKSVVVVPSPVEDPENPYVLTAWRYKLTMQEYDARVVRAFLAEYLGRGPENPVR
ncbi:MAG: DUF3105 domain-containing protein [Halolamina sp.]